MILSMTGYAMVTRELPSGAMNLEIKSVNSRFLDLMFRLNDEVRSLEPMLREMLTEKTTRGKVELRLGFGKENAAGPRAGRPLALNTTAVERLAEAAAAVKRLLPQAQELRVMEVLHWPGVIEDTAVSPEELREIVSGMAREAIAEFSASRQREGEKLKAMLLSRVEGIEGWVKKIEPLMPQILADYHAKLNTRLREALGATDDERVRQEVALFGIKIDVAEELSRLGAHLSEVRRVLAKGGAAGKRLDFLMQELNREANTLGSKSVSAEVSAAAMEMKILIEQMREQVQNLE
ncbi:MAG TPA: YicC/YloC family endoribonuclease [Burkholderiales bacterium]|jgi:uncharacterized protein (TIGR00255 family)|nr:YicC/YloC family endoribonuclease [Burkholderiales bacterium]